MSSFLHFGYLTLTVCVLSVAHSHDLSVPHRTLAVLPDSTEILDCTGFEWSGNITGEPQRFSWIKNGESVVLDERDSNGLERTHQFPNGSLALHSFKSHKNSGIFYSHLVGNAKKIHNDNADLYQCILQGPQGAVVHMPIHVLSAVGPSFTRNGQPKSTSANIGGVVRFHCSVGEETFPLASYSWKINRENLPHDSHYTVIPGGILQIANVKEKDLGQYQCIAFNSIGSVASQYASLNITKEPSTSPKIRPPTVIAKPSNITAKASSNVILECLVDGYPLPEVTWSYGDGKLANHKKFKRIGHGNLKISNVSEKDAGKYTCNACILRTSKCLTLSAHVMVESKPEIIIRPISVTKYAAETARFVCSYNSSLHPKPYLMWLKDGRPLKSAGRVKLLKQKTNLVISQTTATDQGVYQCILSNRIGYATAVAKLFFITSLEAPDTPELTILDVGSASITLEWGPSNDAELPIVAYTVHYCKTDGGVEQQKIESNSGTTLVDLDSLTNYTIYIVAYNKKSASKHSQHITVATRADARTNAPSLTVKTVNATVLKVSIELPQLYRRKGEVTEYTLFYKESLEPVTHSVKISGSLNYYFVTGLHPQTTYHLSALAATSNGYPNLPERDWIWVTASTTPHPSSQRLSSLQMQLIIKNASTILVTWRALSDESVLGYKLYYQCESEPIYGPVIHVRTASSQLLHNLVPKKLYTIMLQSFDKTGDGKLNIKYAIINEGADEFVIEESNLGSQRLNPLPPSNVTVTVKTPTCLKLSWEAPATTDDYESHIIRYTVKFSALLPSSPTAPDVTMFKFRQTDKTHIFLTDMRPFTTYEFSIKSHNRLRAGPYSSKIRQVMPEDIPSCPVAVIWKSKGVESGRVEWQPPLFHNGILKEYIVLYKLENPGSQDLSWQELRVPSRKQWVMLWNLRPQSNYDVKVSASNGAGRCIPSRSLSIQTQGSASNPLNTTCQGCHHESVKENVEKQGIKLRSSSPVEVSSNSMLGLAVGIMIGLVCLVLCLLAFGLRRQYLHPYANNANNIDHRGGSSIKPSLDLFWAKYTPSEIGCGELGQRRLYGGSYLHHHDHFAMCKSEQDYMDEVTWMIIGKQPFCSTCFEAGQFQGPRLDLNWKEGYRANENDSNSSDSGFRCAPASEVSNKQLNIDHCLEHTHTVTRAFLPSRKGVSISLQQREMESAEPQQGPLFTECQCCHVDSNTVSSGQDSNCGLKPSREIEQNFLRHSAGNVTRDLYNTIENTSPTTSSTSLNVVETSTLGNANAEIQANYLNYEHHKSSTESTSVSPPMQNNSGNLNDIRAKDGIGPSLDLPCNSLSESASNQDNLAHISMATRARSEVDEFDRLDDLGPVTGVSASI